MAKITVTFEDFDDGVHVNVHSDTSNVEELFETDKELTDAEAMCLLMTNLLANKMKELDETSEEKACGCPHKH